MPRAVLTFVSGALVVLAAWVGVGPHHRAFPWVVAAGVFGVLGVVGLAGAAVPRWAVATTPRTLVRARALGIPAMLRALDRVGWNAALGRGRNTVHGRAGLVAVRKKATESVGAHGIGALLHLLVSILVAGAGAWSNALILFLLGVPLHWIPLAMQQYILARINRVARWGSSA